MLRAFASIGQYPGLGLATEVYKYIIHAQFAKLGPDHSSEV
jgi:hypothetical protein